MNFTEPLYRPPLEVESLLIRGSQGCTYNDCHFCNISREHAYMVVPLEHIRTQLEEMAPRFAKNTKVYVTGSNTFALPFAHLQALLSCIREYIPHCPEISMSTRITDIRDKTTEELQALRDLGLKHLYPGTETGSEEVLVLMNKGHTAQDSVEQLQRLDSVGIAYTVTYLLGLGGKGKAEQSALATAAMFNQTHPRRIGTTGLTVFPHTPLSHMQRQGQFQEPSELEKLQEMQIFLQALDIETIFDSRHYLNLMNILAMLPAEKQKALQRIEDFLTTHTEDSITEFYSRNAFVSM